MEKSENVTVSTHWAYKLLYIAFVVAPILAGLDKFFNILTDWSMYLSPIVTNIIPVQAQTFMKVVGVIEVAAGIIVAIRPKIGGIIVSAWLLAIIVNLMLTKGYYDIALRDLGLSLGAASLSLLSKECCRCK